ncbi:hypothetical protein KUCAC02_020790, partial [Chaenocephalus aceratus]
AAREIKGMDLIKREPTPGGSVPNSLSHCKPLPYPTGSRTPHRGTDLPRIPVVWPC